MKAQSSDLFIGGNSALKCPKPKNDLPAVETIPEIIDTGQTIEQAKRKSVLDFENDIIEAAVEYATSKPDADESIAQAVQKYFTALRAERRKHRV